MDRSSHPPLALSTPHNKKRGLGIGLKILGGVALVSNLCIGMMLHDHLRSGDHLAGRVDELLLVKEQLNDDLRATVAKLQNDLLGLPHHFKNDAVADLLVGIETYFEIVEKSRIEGRQEVSRQFDRNQRRDLAKGRPVVLSQGERLLLALPEQDQPGNLVEAVTLLTLSSREATADPAGRLLVEIERLHQAQNSDAMLRHKVDQLLAKTGDAALAAEHSRTEILRQVERIRAEEKLVSEVRDQQRRSSLVLGGLAVIANLVALWLLTRTVVERPLRRLTEAVGAIAQGQAVEIPYGKRRDQIGILAGALRGFRDARHRLEAEGARRARESAIMEEMLGKLTETVAILDNRARVLANGALTLRQAAEATLERAEGVGRQARETAARSLGVADGATRLQQAVATIDLGLSQQNRIATALLADNAEGQRHLAGLDSSLAAVTNLLSALSEINDQTKLLSLNATIEAATAGAAGKGFAVVASEVKALSQRTAEATREARERLVLIKESRRILATHLDKVHGQIQRQEEHSREIISAVAQQRRVGDEIAQFAGESSAISDETSRSIAVVADEAASSLRLAAEVENAAKDISHHLGELLEENRNRLGSLLEISPQTETAAPACESSASPLPAPHRPVARLFPLPRLAMATVSNRST